MANFKTWSAKPAPKIVCEGGVCYVREVFSPHKQGDPWSWVVIGLS